MGSHSKEPVLALDNYLPDEGDFFDPFESPTNSPTQSPKSKDAKKRKELGGELGIDEEVSVAKRARIPRVKLDETRLLSEKGIPSLRKRAAGLKLKGKGHEFSDAARLLSFYQLWLDDLFPKAKFLDALAMVEKAGHKTTMHKARMDWINELKPGMAASKDDEPAGQEAATDTTSQGKPRQPTRIAPIFERQSEGASGNGVGANVDALFGEDPGDIYNASPKVGLTQGHTHSQGGGEPDDDDLDALMAEAETSLHAPPAPAVQSLFGPRRPPASGATDNDPDDDDLDALMAEAELHTSSTKPMNSHRPAQVDPRGNDDLDAMMAEAEAWGGT